MKSKTHIVVVRMKEIIYTAIFLIFAVLLILLLLFMFGQKGKSQAQPSVNADHINGVSLINLEESVATMYPLLKTCTEDISSQLAANASLSEITYDSSNQYTYQLLTQAIEKALDKAKNAN